MKKLILIITVAIVFAFSNMAMAEQAHISVGLKTWAATWDTKLDTGSGNKDFSSDYGLMLGPSVNVQYDKYFAGASYLFGTFSFPAVSFEGTVGGVDVAGDTSYDADRSDLDLSAGYYFHPNVAAFIGYKLLDFKFKNKTNVCTTGLIIVCDESSDSSSQTANGPVIGVTGHYSIEGTRWVIFGNLSYVMLSSDVENDLGDTTTVDVTGPAFELGGAYAMVNIPLSVSAGYKYQSYEADTKGSTPDIFSGFTFGVNYTIQ